jgi:hypothetical protein
MPAFLRHAATLGSRAKPRPACVLVPLEDALAALDDELPHALTPKTSASSTVAPAARESNEFRTLIGLSLLFEGH